MGYRARTRLKTLLVSLGILTITMYTVLNLLASEFSVEIDELGASNYGQDHVKNRYLNQKANENFVLQVQRKPKTTTGNMEERTHMSKKLLKSSMDTLNKRNNLLTNQDNELSNNRILNNQVDSVVKQSSNLNPEAYNDYEEEYDDDDNYNDDDDDDDMDDEYDEKEQEFPTNAPFKPGDFGDIRGLEYHGSKPKLKYERVIPEKEKKTSKPTIRPKPLITDNGMFWSKYVESVIPQGLPNIQVTKLLQKWRGHAVQTLEKPGWNRCGRPQNGFVVLDDGTKMCARYREPHSSFVYGESLSFFLSRLLKMDNVPAVVLSVTNATFPQWRAVNISALSWSENRTVALIQWIDGLNDGKRAYIPPLLLHAYRTGQPITSAILHNSAQLRDNPAQIAEIVQWGTMIIFDFLTGNYDRVASMQDAEEKENNPHIIEESIRNLHKSSSDGKLWLIDNESGLLDAYDLLNPHDNNQRFQTFHNKMLQTMCIFQSSLVKALKRLDKSPYPHQRLLNYAQSMEPLLENISSVKPYQLFIKMFDKRLKTVIRWINHCEQLQKG